MDTNPLIAIAGRLGRGGGPEIDGRRGLGAWVIDRLRRRCMDERRMTVLEQLRVGPRQQLLLVEIEGQRVLVSTSETGTAAFYPLSKSRAAGKRKGPVAVRVEGICA